MTLPLSPKQMEFVLNSTAKWNLAHGSVRSGKTVCTLFRFLQAVEKTERTQEIYIAGHSFATAQRNVIVPLMNSPEFEIFHPFLTWSGKKLYFKNKVIEILGAKDEGALKNFQGQTMSVIYCNEMALYPESITLMIDTRLSREKSIAFADMNPEHPGHIIKQWIDKGLAGDSNYYSLHFTLDDNPFLEESYKQRIRDSLSGVYYKRNYLGLWCLAEGAIFDFFDYATHTEERAPMAANYHIAGIDYGVNNNFACTLIGINDGRYTQMGVKMWVEEEYVWDSTARGRQKTNLEYADDVQAFLEPYGVKLLYIDPSALSFKLELQKRGFHVIDADNDVKNGISYLVAKVHSGELSICRKCKHLIQEIESYVWDMKSSERGIEKPVKKNDHCIDALRYAIFSHRVNKYDPYKQQQTQADWMRNKYEVTRRFGY